MNFFDCKLLRLVHFEIATDQSIFRLSHLYQVLLFGYNRVESGLLVVIGDQLLRLIEQIGVEPKHVVRRWLRVKHLCLLGLLLRLGVLLESAEVVVLDGFVDSVDVNLQVAVALVVDCLLLRQLLVNHRDVVHYDVGV